MFSTCPKVLISRSRDRCLAPRTEATARRLQPAARRPAYSKRRRGFDRNVVVSQNRQQLGIFDVVRLEDNFYFFFAVRVFDQSAQIGRNFVADKRISRFRIYIRLFEICFLAARPARSAPHSRLRSPRSKAGSSPAIEARRFSAIAAPNKDSPLRKRKCRQRQDCFSAEALLRRARLSRQIDFALAFRVLQQGADVETGRPFCL